MRTWLLALLLLALPGMAIAPTPAPAAPAPVARSGGQQLCFGPDVHVAQVDRQWGTVFYNCGDLDRYFHRDT